jgi:hypothetical protein
MEFFSWNCEYFLEIGKNGPYLALGMGPNISPIRLAEKALLSPLLIQCLKLKLFFCNYVIARVETRTQERKTEIRDQSQISSIWFAEMLTSRHFRQSDDCNSRLVCWFSFMILGTGTRARTRSIIHTEYQRTKVYHINSADWKIIFPHLQKQSNKLNITLR